MSWTERLLGEGEAPEWRALAFLVRYRLNGFMVLRSDAAEVVSRLQEAAPDEEASLGTVPAFKNIEVETETSRRRLTGATAALIADFDWAFLDFFRRAVSGTTRAAGGLRLITLKAGDAVVRPLRPSALAVSAICSPMPAWPSTSLPKRVPRRTRSPTTNQAKPRRSPRVCRGRKLRSAGAVPSRLASHERAERNNATVLAETALAEEELGPPALLQLLATQAKLLEKAMAPKTVDPIAAALSGGASGSDSGAGSSSGARGMAARDAYPKDLRPVPGLRRIGCEASPNRGLGKSGTFNAAPLPRAPSSLVGPQDGAALQFPAGPHVGGCADLAISGNQRRDFGPEFGDVEFLESRMPNRPPGGADQEPATRPRRPPRRPKALGDKPQRLGLSAESRTAVRSCRAQCD